ncbi:prolipoprotein diacylglyceryl transferase family protein [Rhizobium sp. PAMB 3182]
MLLHTIFDALAWLTSFAVLYVLRRTWFPKNPVSRPLRGGYIAAVVFGAGVSAWVFGSLNLWLSGQPGFGRSVEGALFGAIVSVELYKRASGILERTGAIYALPVALGIAVGRIGCLMSGMEDFTYGIPTGADWGWDFGDGIPRHPVALYESLAMASFAIVYIGMILRGSAYWRANGFYLAVGFYGLERFVLEFWKPYGAVIAGLSVFQLLSLLMVGYALVMLQGSRSAVQPEGAG